MPTLADIQEKVRKLTRSPSTAQLGDAEITDYINTFILYDMPYMDSLFELKRTLTFYTCPFVDTYATNTVDATNPLYDFKNRVTGVEGPLYVAGLPSNLVFRRDIFYGAYPRQFYIENTPIQGDGIMTHFVGTLGNIPSLQNTVSFSSFYLDPSGAVIQLVLRDSPDYDGATGNMLTTGRLVIPDNAALTMGTINYVTGAYDFNFPFPPAIAAPVTAEYYPYVASRPYIILFFNNTFYMRPIPDKVYAVTFNVLMRPTELIDAADVPDIAQWWQYIAYGAAKKVFEDRTDTESIQKIMPEFENQEILATRKTTRELAQEKSVTLYEFPVNYNWGDRFFPFGM